LVSGIIGIGIIGIGKDIPSTKAETKINELKGKVSLKIGLYCGGTPSALATKYVLNMLQISLTDVKRITYRGDGWPGFMTIYFKEGGLLRVPFEEYWRLGFGQAFMRKRCLVCADHTAELSDISLADPWTLKSNNVRDGLSIIVTRTLNGESTLKDAEKAGYLHLEELHPRVAIQDATISKKRNKISNSVKLLLGLGSLPHDYDYPLPLDLNSIIGLIYYRVFSFLGKYESLWFLLKFARKIKTYVTH